MGSRLLLLFLALIGAATTAEAEGSHGVFGVLGADDRRVVDAGEARWFAVGRIERRDGNFCTGVLIAPARVLTAAHCLWDLRAGRFLFPFDLHFLAGYRRGRYVGYAVVQEIVTSPELRFDSRGRPARIEDDWAVLELARPIVGVAPLSVFDSGLEEMRPGEVVLTRIGYSRDRPHLPMRVRNCHLLARAFGGILLVHDCDATYGDSGSPLLVRTPSGYRVLGVQSALMELGARALPVAVLVHGHIPEELLH